MEDNGTKAARKKKIEIAAMNVPWSITRVLIVLVCQQDNGHIAIAAFMVSEIISRVNADSPR